MKSPELNYRLRLGEGKKPREESYSFKSRANSKLQTTRQAAAPRDSRFTLTNVFAVFVVIITINLMSPAKVDNFSLGLLLQLLYSSSCGCRQPPPFISSFLRPLVDLRLIPEIPFLPIQQETGKATVSQTCTRGCSYRGSSRNKVSSQDSADPFDETVTANGNNRDSLFN